MSTRFTGEDSDALLLGPADLDRDRFCPDRCPLYLGLRCVSNLSGRLPLVIWITYDVATGTAIACGGYAVAI